MTFYKVFPNGKKTQISKEEARELILKEYGNRGIESNMRLLLRDRIFGAGYFIILFYEPTPETYCSEQGCESDPEKCGYYPSMCIKDKYGAQ